MIYVYDIILNFNHDFYEFYEWKRDDTLYHIKKINMIKVDSKVYNDFFDNYVLFNNDFLLSIFNKCEYYNNHKIDTIPYSFLITDSYRVMGLLLDNNGTIIKYSSLLLDEEEDVLDLCYKLGEIKVEYKIIRKRDKCEYLTRQEKNIVQFIKKNLRIDYEKSDLNKLKYLYYEYFNKQCENINIIYQELMKELENSITEKHYNLYHLIKLSYSSKSV